MSISDFGDALGLLLQPGPLLAIPIGCVIGLFFGVIPGLSGGTALALAISLVLSMDPMTAVVLMVSIYASDTWGGSITAILLNIPGTGGSTATAVEGHRMTQQGRAGEAIAIGRSAAFVGGMFGSLVLLLLAPLVARWAVQFGPAEYLALAIFGVTIVAAISEKKLVKAFISGWIGFLLATIGQDPVNGFPRFAFGNAQLFSGLNMIWVVVGLFAIAQAFRLIAGDEHFRQYHGKIDVPWRSAWPVLWLHKRLVLLAASIGTLTGTIPGAGSTIAGWLGYNVAQRTSKHPERFGKGSVEGVIGPETANDSVDGGSLVPTMTLGIPGSAGAAIILGGLVLAGMRPGPQLFSEQAPQAISVMLAFMLSNMLFLVIAVISVRYLIRILSIPPMVWPPVIIALGSFGAYLIERRMFGAYAALALGLIAYVMARRGFPLAPALLGFILGPILENNYIRLLLVSDDDPVGYVLGRPIALVLFALAIGAVGMDVYQRRLMKKTLAAAQRHDAEAARDDIATERAEKGSDG